MKLRMAILLGLILAGVSAFGGEPAWWTQQKAQCNLSPSLAYNDWVAQGSPCPGSTAGSSSTSAPVNVPGITPQQQLGMQMGTLGANMVVEGFRQLFSRPAVDPVQEQNQIAARQYNDMGIWNLRQKNYAMAVTEFERALGRTPNDQSIVANLAYAKQLLEQSRKDAAAAAQISGALGNLLGDVPVSTGGFNFTAPARSGASIPNASALYFLNLFTDPSVVDLRGTTKTAVDPADLKSQLDALFTNRAPVAASAAAPVQLPNDKDIELLDEVLGAPASPSPGAAHPASAKAVHRYYYVTDTAPGWPERSYDEARKQHEGLELLFPGSDAKDLEQYTNDKMLEAAGKVPGPQ